MSKRHTALVLVGVSLALGGCRTDDVPRPAPASVAALVDRLGSESFAEREEATKQLAAMELIEVPPEVSRALQSTDPEVRRRAASVVGVIRNRFVQRHIDPLRTLARRGEVSLFVPGDGKVESTLRRRSHVGGTVRCRPADSPACQRDRPHRCGAERKCRFPHLHRGREARVDADIKPLPDEGGTRSQPPRRDAPAVRHGDRLRVRRSPGRQRLCRAGRRNARQVAQVLGAAGERLRRRERRYVVLTDRLRR